MKFLFKNIVSSLLSFLFLLSAAHSHPHHGQEHSGSTIINENLVQKHHHSNIHECEKCLKKNNKLKVENIFELQIESSPTLYVPSNESFENNTKLFYLNSRPPPSSHI
jgi:uncharacterized surface protein with fasciclin (FAS1) repeats